MSSQDDFTLNKGVSELNDAWRTEANSPEILPFRKDLVEFIKSKIESQQSAIDSKVDDRDEREYFTTTIYQMDIERVRYSLSRYLRSRVLKIEKCLEYINVNIDVFDRLSAEEKVFASKLNTLNNQYFEDVVATRLLGEARDYYESSDDRVKNAEPSFQVRYYHSVLHRAGMN